MKARQGANENSSKLPPTSRYPVLVSGQVSFTNAAAIKELEQAPKHVYRIQVELKPRNNDTNFKKAPWTLVARHFFSTLQLYDDTAIIIRKKEKAVANKISSPEELPENPEDFERDYAYDVKLKSEKSVTFKLIIGTRQPYWKTFKGQLYKKLVDNEWYVKYGRLENQGTVASIGHLMFAHNRYVNQEDVISELRNLIYPTHCDQIDVRVTKSKEYYYEENKKVRVYTKWITIDCPVDIANDLSNLIMERWKLLQTDKKFINYNLKNTVYVPRHRGLVDFNSRIENIGKQNEFLRTYKDVTVISNVNDIDASFKYSKEMGKIFDDESKVGHNLDLRAFLRSWNDNTTEKPAIIAIHRTNSEKEYSLLSGNKNMENIHATIVEFVEELKQQEGFHQLRVGGTKGTTSQQNHPETITNYARENFTTSRRFDQKPRTEQMLDNEDEEQTKESTLENNQWKSPPVINRRKQKGTKASLTVNYDDKQLVQQYRDVVTGNSYATQHNGTYTGQNNMVPITGNNRSYASAANNNNTITIHEGDETGKMKRKEDRQQLNHQTVKEILESKMFQDSLAKAVAPQVTQQVTSLVAPTIEKITHIETQVDELHNYVSGNKEWQSSQSSRQSNLQTSMNEMQSSMNSMLMMFKQNMEKEAGTKRAAPNATNPINSPTRKQRTGMYHQQSTLIESTQKSNQNQSDNEASNPLISSKHTFSEDSADEAMMPTDTTGEGEEQ